MNRWGWGLAALLALLAAVGGYLAYRDYRGVQELGQQVYFELEYDGVPPPPGLTDDPLFADLPPPPPERPLSLGRYRGPGPEMAAPLPGPAGTEDPVEPATATPESAPEPVVATAVGDRPVAAPERAPEAAAPEAEIPLAEMPGAEMPGDTGPVAEVPAPTPQPLPPGPAASPVVQAPPPAVAPGAPAPRTVPVAPVPPSAAPVPVVQSVPERAQLAAAPDRTTPVAPRDTPVTPPAPVPAPEAPPSVATVAVPTAQAAPPAATQALPAPRYVGGTFLERIRTPARIRVLLIGTDQEVLGRGRADVLLLLTFDPVDRTLRLLSIPRDTLITLPGRGTVKINAAYALGGPSLQTEAVERLLGLATDKYIEISLAGFREAVDVLGGVTVNPEFAFSLDGTDFTPGAVRLGGQDALAYTRMRRGDPTGDFGRNRRQQEVVRSLMAAVSDLPPAQLLPLIGELSEHLRTNFSPSEVVELRRTHDYATSRQQSVTMQGRGEVRGGVWYFIVGDRERQRLHLLLR